jgi:hypothetical protein
MPIVVREPRRPTIAPPPRRFIDFEQSGVALASTYGRSPQEIRIAIPDAHQGSPTATRVTTVNIGRIVKIDGHN